MKKYILILALAFAGALCAEETDPCRIDKGQTVIIRGPCYVWKESMMVEGVAFTTEAAKELLSAIDLLAPKVDVNTRYISYTTSTGTISLASVEPEKTAEQKAVEDAEEKLAKAKKLAAARATVERFRTRIKISTHE